jgi:hypothetical protein
MNQQHKPKQGQRSFGQTANQNMNNQVLQKQQIKIWTTKSWQKQKPKLEQSIGQ